MDKPSFSISVVSGAFLVFIVLCSPIVSIPLAVLISYLLLLHVGLVWMVISILKYGKESRHTFDKRFYDDADLGPGT